MEQYPYWRKQSPDKPLFPEIEWSKPEQKTKAGRLGIIGGDKLGFIGVAESYSTALKSGVGSVRVLLPDTLKKTVPASMLDIVFGPSNPSGSLSREALTEMKTLGTWSEEILLIGDAGKNSETAIVYEDFIRDYQGKLTITRDAIDLLKNNYTQLVDRPNTLIIASFAQLQKIFQTVYYPKVLTFSMQLTTLVESIHKFTITYPITIVVFHQENLILAHDGQVVTSHCDNPMNIWRGITAAKAAAYWIWSPTKPLESIATSFLS